MKNILFIVLIIVSNFGFSQNSNSKIDSLKNSIEKSSNDSIIMMTYSKLRRAATSNNPQEALYYNSEYLKIAIKRKDSFREALGYFYMGNLNIAKSDYEGALNAYFKAINYFELKKDSMRLSSVLNGVGAVHLNNGNDTLSLKYFKKAQKISHSLKDTRRSAIALSNISTIYSDRNELKLAEKYLQQAYAEIMQTEIAGYKTIISIKLASLYTDLKEFEKANELYNETLLKIDTINDTYNHALILKSLGNLYLAKGNNKLALNYLDRSYEKFKFYNYFDQLYKVMPDLIKALEINKRYDLSLQMFYEYNTIKDSVFNIEKDKSLTNLLVKHESFKKDTQLKVLKLENEKSEKDRKLFFYLALAGLLFTGLIGYFFFKNKIKNKQIEKALSEKEMLLKEIHHRVKNNLQVISSLLNLQQRQLKDESLKQLFQESRNRIKAMSLIHQNLYNDKDLTSINIRVYLQSLINNLVKNYNYRNTSIETGYDISNVKLDVDTIIYLGLIVNELISNILKYAFENEEKGRIKVSLNSNSKDVILIVEDNGVGMPKEFLIDKTTSLGFKLIKAFSQKLGAKLRIDKLVKGTKITILFPNLKLN